MNGIDVLAILSVAGVIDKHVSKLTLTARADGYLSINAEYFVLGPEKDTSELDRLKTIEAAAAKVVKLLNEGQVDYDLVKELKGLLDG